MDSQQRDEIRDLLADGLSSVEIAEQLGIPKMRVAAVKAHTTLGTYPHLVDRVLRGTEKDPALMEAFGAVKSDPTFRAELEREAVRRLKEAMDGIDDTGRLALQLAESDPKIAETIGIGLNSEMFGRGVHMRRVELGLKRRELAERAQLSYPYLSQVENGSKQPSLVAVARLAAALELKTSELMGYTAIVREKPAVEADAGSKPPELEDGERADDRQSSHAPRQDEGKAKSVASNSTEERGGATQDWQTQTMISAVVRAELAAWARTELPALISAAIERALLEHRG
jgi:transcriptional regulator with XRE-family HTH domain